MRPFTAPVAVPSSVIVVNAADSLSWKRAVRTTSVEKRPTVGSATRVGVAETDEPPVGDTIRGADVFSVEPSDAALTFRPLPPEGAVGPLAGPLHAAIVAPPATSTTPNHARIRETPEEK